MTTSDSTYGRQAIAATFADRTSANDALTELHHAGFRDVWLGIVRADAYGGANATVESASGGGVLDSVGRFFSGEGTQAQALHHALIARGLGEDEARRLEMSASNDSAIVVVQGENDAAAAIEILQANGGGVEGSYAKTNADARSTDVEAQRLQLREERLLVDKQRVQSGEARVHKEVVSQQQSIDVPVFREELFIERRPVSGAASAKPIGDSEEIRIPLSAERVDVQKRTVVTEEVTIGKRKVEGQEHVSDTVRHEELRVEDSTTGATAAADERNPRR